MNRRDFVKASFATAAFPFIGTTKQSVADTHKNYDEKRPNFIFLFTDDQGWGDLGCFGHPVLKTPNLDRLAAEGCKLNSFYVTAPVCAPSRAGAMTGRIQNRYRLNNIMSADSFRPTTRDEMTHVPLYHFVPLKEPMLPRQLQQAGYYTGHIGKWHISLLEHRNKGVPTPSNYGFDYWLTLEGGGKGPYKAPSGWIRNGEKVDGKLADWANELYFEDAIRFIEDKGEKPFYLNIWSFTPHQTGDNIDCPDEYKQMYADRTVEEQIYFGSITQFDNELGKFLDYLDKTGLSDNTVIVFGSDNGPESAVVPWGHKAARGRAPFRGHKHVLYEGGIRIPGIVRWPGLAKPGSESNLPVSTLDLFPTFCNAAGVELPDEPSQPLDGGDFRAVFTGKPVQRRQPLYWQYEFAPSHFVIGSGTSPALAMRDGHWKILSDMSFDNFELYNLHIDPAEHWNLAKRHPDILERMKKNLKQVYDDVNSSYKYEAKFLSPNVPNPYVQIHTDRKF